MSISDIQKKIVDCLLNGVNEVLIYVKIVEENLNASNNHVSIQKAANTLWVEVDVYHKWLRQKLPKPKANTTEHTTKNMVIKMEGADIWRSNKQKLHL